MNPHASPRISLRAVIVSGWTNRQSVAALVQCEVVGRYRGLMMGLLWSMLNPLLVLLVYAFVFSVVFKSTNVAITNLILSLCKVSVASKGGPCSSPNLGATDQYLCIFSRVFNGGGRLKNQLKKIAICIGVTGFACDNSGSETNVQGVVAVLSVTSVEALL